MRHGANFVILAAVRISRARLYQIRDRRR